VRQVIVEIERIDDAEPLAAQPFLVLEVRDGIDRTQSQRVRLAAQEIRGEQAGHVGRAYRPEGAASRRRLHFDQWLQPESPARAVAHDAHRIAAARCLGRNRTRNRLGAERECGGRNDRKRAAHDGITAT